MMNTKNTVIEDSNVDLEPPAHAGDDLLTKLENIFPDSGINDNPAIPGLNLSDDQSDLLD